MNPNLKFILFLLTALILGFGIGWVCNNKKPEIEVDKHKKQNELIDRKIDSAFNLIKSLDKNYSSLEKRISNTDSLAKETIKKGNETKAIFHRSNYSNFNDSVLRANNLLNR